jgi:putative drug exporter of the RND superfamily
VKAFGVRVLTIASGRISRWFVLILSIVILGGLGSLAGKLDSVVKNEAESFLPGSAESSKVLKDIKRYPNGQTASAVVLYYRPGGLRKSDLAQIQAARVKLNRNLPPFTLAAPPVVVSKNGTTALIVPELKFTGKSDVFKAAVKGIDNATTFSAPGLTRRLTGPVGLSNDAIKVFGNIDGTLLLVTGGLVFVLLVLIYRSPIFWLIPFISVLFAEGAARGLAYLLAKGGVVVNGQSQGILPVLVFGAGTDYALLLVARYREELRRHENKLDALHVALRRAGVPILASGLTVICALLCLTFAEVNGTAGLGPIAAMGIAVAMLTMLTLLPALLATVGGRKAFWPRIPHHGDSGADETHGFWRRVGEWVARRPRTVAACTTLLLLVLALGLLSFNTNLTQANGFRGDVPSVEGQKLLQAAFPAGASVPVDIIVPDAANVPRVVTAAEQVPGVESAVPGQRGPPGVRVEATLNVDPYSVKAYDVIPRIRTAVKHAGGDDVLVGGGTAQEADLRTAAARDTRVIVPIALAVVFLILLILLRAVVAPLMLIATVILSFAAALGIGSFFSIEVFGFAGLDPSYPLFVFIFLVALGIDYNIFLMARVREESVRHGTHVGMMRGLAVTGAVITSAGIVLAGTFSALAVLKLVFLTELGFTIAIGVLLDTFLVRSILVPSLTEMLGDRVWWPSKLWRREGYPPPEPEPDEPPSDRAPLTPSPAPGEARA